MRVGVWIGVWMCGCVDGWVWVWVCSGDVLYKPPPLVAVPLTGYNKSDTHARGKKRIHPAN